ncbi:MAG: PEGA domain-containing protein, partial [Acidobacteriota bacterium]|nr:PEGA domain-containing protein [Acidobacteriota bacterium]
NVKLIVSSALAVLLVAGIFLFVLREPAVEEKPAPVAAAPPPPPAVTAEPEPAAAEPAPSGPAPTRRAPVVRKAEPPPSPVAPAAPTLATLVLESDVPGASVFVNREYVGTTPLRLDRLEPGSKQLKLTADGYEGIERTVDLAAGNNPVTMRFREVRLDTRVAVTHKHGMGSCEGTLVATIDGLAYQTTNKNDAFTLPYEQVDTFVVDYLEKNLRVKQKGGKTWNFTDKAAANADALFVFHRDVEAARKKLAQGYTAVR